MTRRAIPVIRFVSEKLESEGWRIPGLIVRQQTVVLRKLLLAFAFFSVWSAFGAFPSDPEIEKLLKDSAAGNNRTASYRLDDKLRVDSTTAGPGKVVTYNFTYYAAGSLKEKIAYIDALRPTIRMRVLADPHWRKILPAGIIVVYRFRDIDQRLIGELSVSAADLKKQKDSTNTVPGRNSEH
jgi:hypothetical protein